jgi:UDP-N-acetylglucosamine 4-epimerase
MPAYPELKARLLAGPKRWLVTGAAGFIGSHLVETLLKLDQTVAGLDNFATGRSLNLEQIKAAVAPAQWARFHFIEGDIRDALACRRACEGVELVLHQAALGSVPRSMETPALSHAVNVDGTLQVFLAARDAGARRLVYASSSAVYGDEPALPKTEGKIGQPLSPYAATKWINEIYAGVFGRCYGLQNIGLRYFNVFGPRQDPEGPYAAVIPKWIAAMLHGDPVVIHGDGETSRDFCYVANVVQANLLAATAENPAAIGKAYNVAVGQRTTLNELFALLKNGLGGARPGLQIGAPKHTDFRAGDVRHSLADISQARTLLRYAPTHQVADGLAEALEWYLNNPAPHEKST